MKLMKN